MTLGSLSSFATTAFDTARSTFKAMAEAAVPPAEAGRNIAAGAAEHAPPRSPRPAEPLAAAKTTAQANAEEPKPPSRRRGALLDAYA